MQQFLRHRALTGSCANHGRILPVTKPKRNKGELGVFSDGTPPLFNLIAFKRAKASARRIRGNSQRFLDPVHIFDHIVYYEPTVMEKTNLIGETFASVSSSDSYNATFLAIENRSERTPISFRCRQFLPYNCDFYLWELKRALSSAHNTSPGPDGILYEILHHLDEDSLLSLLYLCNRIWMEQVYPSIWEETIVIHILKPGKDPKHPLSYRPIALTSCLGKTMERMVNVRLIYQLEKNRCIPLFSEWFPQRTIHPRQYHLAGKQN
ncbi:putative RNA-directed DNA polymerase from transposon X-element [Trichonephila clavipes]|nr:putative RNA-directed DNA polymerase from transposon X-element [Trichonephila clavipes]